MSDQNSQELQKSVPSGKTKHASHTSLTRRAKKTIFDFFNNGRGSRLAALAVDAHFCIWRFKNPGKSFADYYAGSIAEMLRRGGSHKTLGDKQFLSGALIGPNDSLDYASSRNRGSKYFDAVRNLGLRPGHLCVDYGCGSLRVGQHFINYLETGKYIGLDVIEDFYLTGQSILPSQLLTTKAPQFCVINEENLTQIAHLKPDFIFSFAVLKHVPPQEVDIYFRRLLGMMTPQTVSAITFDENRRTGRTGAKIWAYNRKQIEDSVLRMRPEFKCTFNKFRGLQQDVGNGEPRTTLLTINFPSTT